MATEIVGIGPEHRAVMRRFSERTWQRPRSEAFYRWRYDECPAITGYLALRDGECVAMATGFERPYRIGKDTVTVRESFDWFCLPEYRRAGLGVRVMQRMMQDPEPVTVIGGTADTRDLLPRLGFRIPGEVASYVLPLGSRRAAEALRERARIPRPVTRAGFAVLGPFLAPRRRAAPEDGRLLPVGAAGAEIQALYARAHAYGSFPLWRLDQLHWTAQSFPGVGQFLTLYFLRGDALAGWGLLRIHEVPGVGLGARIVELFAPEPDADLFTWMVSETSCLAAAYRPDYIAASASHPLLAEGLRRNRFRAAGGSAPIHFWSHDRETLPGPLFFCGSWGDAPLLPYPTRWWDGLEGI